MPRDYARMHKIAIQKKISSAKEFRKYLKSADLKQPRRYEHRPVGSIDIVSKVEKQAFGKPSE